MCPSFTPGVGAVRFPYQMPLEAAQAVAVLEAELTEVEDGQSRQLLGVG